MKIFFILLILIHSVFAQYNLSTAQQTNDFNLKKDYKLFYIQVGAFKNQKYAIIVLEHLEEMDYPVTIDEKRIGIDNYFKLLIGPYRTREEAYSTKKLLPLQYFDSFILTYNN